MKLPALFAVGLVPFALVAADSNLKPLMAVPDRIVYQDDFSKPAPLHKDQWGARQGTRWMIEGGVLQGRPSSTEYRAKRKDHFGYEPRISAPVTPAQFIAEFSVRFSGGSETPVSPFVEFGHHVIRVRLGKSGTEMLADHESIRVGEAKNFNYQPGKWYHALAEMKGDEFVIQFENGPTLYARHECIGKPVASGGSGLGVAGPKEGLVEIDNVKFWSIQSKEQPGWMDKRASLSKFTPVEAKAMKGK